MIDPRTLFVSEVCEPLFNIPGIEWKHELVRLQGKERLIEKKVALSLRLNITNWKVSGRWFLVTEMYDPIAFGAKRFTRM